VKSATKAILAGGGLAATFDIIYAFVLSAPSGVSPTRVLQSVASGLLGNRAFQGGTAAAAVGLLAHYGILFAAAALYLAASRRLPWLRERAVLCGLASHAILVGLPIALALRHFSRTEVRA
jgi:hypothetical protein